MVILMCALWKDGIAIVVFNLFQGGVLVFQLHHMFDLLLLVLVAQQVSVSISQLVQLLLVCTILIEQRISLRCKSIELFLWGHTPTRVMLLINIDSYLFKIT